MADVEIHPPKRWERIFYAVVRSMLIGFSRVFFRLRVEGAENIPTDTPFVLAPVHRSNLDFFLVSAVTHTRMRYMGKDSIWKFKLPGRLISALGAFPVRRGSADREALRASIEVIENGEPLVLFPEGTRQSGPIVQDLYDGAAYVASRTGVPIVPVGIGGSERAMPKGSRMIRPVRIAIVVGKPIAPPAAGDSGRVPRRAVREATEHLYTEIQRLFDQAQTRV
jgi:1-acyl-sn-glycerol-3-phosphate acyltransferase